MNSSRDVGGGAWSSAAASGVARPYPGSPVCDITDVRLRTRSGWAIARLCAIIPPIDTPSTWARSTPTASRTATASSAMSHSR